MRALVCPDSFKSTASAAAAAAAIAGGLRAAGWATVELPLADGGEGTAELLAAAAAGPGAPARERAATVADPLGRPVRARWWRVGGAGYVDLAAASGLPLVADALDDPAAMAGAGTAGTGQLLAAALAEGVREITLALGGSATVDAGAGLAAALRAAGGPGPEVTWTILADVTNPPCGPRGAAAVFGPQKGLDAAGVAAAERRIRAACAAAGVDPGEPGYGAAGAAPVGLAALLDGAGARWRLRPGAAAVADAVGLDAALAEADLVVTGEGALDAQSPGGKAVGEVAARAAAARVPLAILAGRVDAAVAAGLGAVAWRALPGPATAEATPPALARAAESLGRELRAARG